MHFASVLCGILVLLSAWVHAQQNSTSQWPIHDDGLNKVVEWYVKICQDETQPIAQINLGITTASSSTGNDFTSSVEKYVLLVEADFLQCLIQITVSLLEIPGPRAMGRLVTKDQSCRLQFILGLLQLGISRPIPDYLRL
jgi:hypothetical protein